MLAQDRSGVAPAPSVSENGTVTTPSFQLPFSSLASAEARAAFAARFRVLASPPTSAPAAPAGNSIEMRRQMSDRGLKGAMDDYAAKYPYTSTKRNIGTVPVKTFVPNAGIPPENKYPTLIPIH